VSKKGMFRAKAKADGLPLIGRFKEMFFDRVAVESKTQAAKLKIQSRFGAYVARRARTSMRRRKKGSSTPGQPPFAKVGLMRDRLFFGYDQATDSVVVGPEGLGKNPGEVPRLHEFGGVASNGLLPVPIAFSRLPPGVRARLAIEAKKKNLLLRDYLRTHVVPEVEAERAYPRVYKKRPFMRPALEAELPKFAGLFRGEVK
jgi:hypothetical protein